MAKHLCINYQKKGSTESINCLTEGAWTRQPLKFDDSYFMKDILICCFWVFSKHSSICMWYMHVLCVWYVWIRNRTSKLEYNGKLPKTGYWVFLGVIVDVCIVWCKQIICGRSKHLGINYQKKGSIEFSWVCYCRCGGILLIHIIYICHLWFLHNWFMLH